MSTKWVIVLAFLTGATGATGTGTPAAAADIVVRSTKGEFQDVKERVLHAIENRGLVPEPITW